MPPTLTETPYLDPESWAGTVRDERGTVLLRSHWRNDDWSRYSYLATNPVLILRARALCCEIWRAGEITTLFGSPWPLLEALCDRFELPDSRDVPFPLGGAFGFWGYDLRHPLEPRLARTAVDDLGLWDAWIGFYPSLLVFDHRARQSWIVATGLDAEAVVHPSLQAEQTEFWRSRLPQARRAQAKRLGKPAPSSGQSQPLASGGADGGDPGVDWTSNLTATAYQSRVRRALDYIHKGDIYQVNLSHRLTAPWPARPWDLYEALGQASPAPFSAWLDCGDLAIASASPELFLRLDGRSILTRPIKGTRPRGADPTADADLARELRQSAKENAELLMITDLLRNDLGRVCEFGSVQVPDLVRLEHFPQVHHLVSTVTGRLRPGISHLTALSCGFPGGSITGTPKIRAMEIIDELEPVTRGPYTGSLGYLGFNGRSQWNILIRTAICQGHTAWFQAGAGIVADSDPAAEYQETLDKARGFLEAVKSPLPNAPG